MSQKTSAFEPTIRRLKRHAAASIMHNDADLLTVIRGCDFSTAEVYKTGEREWNAHYGYEPMIRAFCCKELTGFTTEELHEYLTDAERARTLGFDSNHFAPDKTAPSRTTLGRAWRERFPPQLKTFIQTSAERILGLPTNWATHSDCVRWNLRTRAMSPVDPSSVTSTPRQRR